MQNKGRLKVPLKYFETGDVGPLQFYSNILTVECSNQSCPLNQLSEIKCPIYVASSPEELYSGYQDAISDPHSEIYVQLARRRLSCLHLREFLEGRGE